LIYLPLKPPKIFEFGVKVPRFLHYNTQTSIKPLQISIVLEIRIIARKKTGGLAKKTNCITLYNIHMRLYKTIKSAFDITIILLFNGIEDKILLLGEICLRKNTSGQ
jgi:hypothetical protein